MFGQRLLTYLLLHRIGWISLFLVVYGLGPFCKLNYISPSLYNPKLMFSLSKREKPKALVFFVPLRSCLLI